MAGVWLCVHVVGNIFLFIPCTAHLPPGPTAGVWRVCLDVVPPGQAGRTDVWCGSVPGSWHVYYSSHFTCHDC